MQVEGDRADLGNDTPKPLEIVKIVEIVEILEIDRTRGGSPWNRWLALRGRGYLYHQ